MEQQMAALRAENARLLSLLQTVQHPVSDTPAISGATTHRMEHGAPSGPAAPKRMFGEVKLWVGTWNMGARDPFLELGDLDVHADAAARLLAPFVPQGLDVYVLGVQEGISDRVYAAIEAYTGAFRLPLHTKLYPAREAKVGGDASEKARSARSRRMGRAIRVQAMIEEAAAGEGPAPVTNTANMLDRVWGRGDGALLLPKFTGIAVFVAPVVAPYVRVLGVYKHSFGASEGSKGGVGVALGLYDVSVAFVNTHLASKRADMRRAQYCELVDRLGSKLGGRGFGLNESFHHVIWMGDLNTHCKGVSSADAVELMRTGRHLQLLLQHDELLIEKESESAFWEYEEPLMAPRFFPTYKKLPGRGPVDTRDPDWVSKVYITAYKEPFYKGGRVQERVPSWTDRIQYHSLPDRWGELLPESLDPSRPDASPHNYHAVNDGLDTSDHSPVFCTFSMQICAEEVGEGTDAEGLAQYVESQQAQLGYRQLPQYGAEGEGSADGRATPATPGSGARGVALPTPLPSGPMADADFAALHPSLRPLVVVLRLGGVVLDYGGVAVTPRAVSVLFPLPFEDSDLIPERHKVSRPSSLLPFASRSASAGISAGMRTIVSRASRLESLHLLLKVSLDDGTKAQCVIAMRDGGFVGEGSHMNTFRQTLTCNALPLKAPNGAPANVQFTMEMHAYARGGQMASAERGALQAAQLAAAQLAAAQQQAAAAAQAQVQQEAQAQLAAQGTPAHRVPSAAASVSALDSADVAISNAAPSADASVLRSFSAAPRSAVALQQHLAAQQRIEQAAQAQQYARSIGGASSVGGHSSASLRFNPAPQQPSAAAEGGGQPSTLAASSTVGSFRSLGGTTAASTTAPGSFAAVPTPVPAAAPPGPGGANAEAARLKAVALMAAARAKAAAASGRAIYI